MQQKIKLTGIHSFLVYVFLYFPIIVLIAFSFNQERINAVWTGFTFDWYNKIFHNSELLNAFKNSLIVAISSTFIATIIGTLVAFAMHRYKFPAKKIMDSVLHLPIIIPDIVMAIAMLSFYVFIKLTLGHISIIIAHVSFNIAFVAIIVRSRLSNFNVDYENAAMDLGATPVQTFRFVTLPLILPGVIAGALLAFTLSWDDFMIAFFNSGIGSTTLPIKVYSMIKFGVTPEINAISTIIIFVSICFILISMRLLKK